MAPISKVGGVQAESPCMMVQTAAQSRLGGARAAGQGVPRLCLSYLYSTCQMLIYLLSETSSYPLPHIPLQASAVQRAGRAGRVRPGKAFRMCTAEDFARLPDAAVPEMQRSELQGMVLQVGAAPWHSGYKG